MKWSNFCKKKTCKITNLGSCDSAWYTEDNGISSATISQILKDWSDSLVHHRDIRQTAHDSPVGALNKEIARSQGRQVDIIMVSSHALPRGWASRSKWIVNNPNQYARWITGKHLTIWSSRVLHFSFVRRVSCCPAYMRQYTEVKPGSHPEVARCRPVGTYWCPHVVRLMSNWCWSGDRNRTSNPCQVWFDVKNPTMNLLTFVDVGWTSVSYRRKGQVSETQPKILV